MALSEVEAIHGFGKRMKDVRNLPEYSGLNQEIEPDCGMTLDEKVRLGMMALAGASIVFASLGLHVGTHPLEIIGGAAEG